MNTPINVIDRFLVRIKSEKAEYLRNGIGWEEAIEVSDAERVLLEAVRAAVLDEDCTPEYLFFEGVAAKSTAMALIEDAIVAAELCLSEPRDKNVVVACLSFAKAAIDHAQTYVETH